jgi:hypothetical protein
VGFCVRLQGRSQSINNIPALEITRALIPMQRRPAVNMGWDFKHGEQRKGKRKGAIARPFPSVSNKEQLPSVFPPERVKLAARSAVRSTCGLRYAAVSSVSSALPRRRTQISPPSSLRCRIIRNFVEVVLSSFPCVAHQAFACRAAQDSDDSNALAQPFYLSNEGESITLEGFSCCGNFGNVEMRQGPTHRKIENQASWPKT